MAYYHRWQNDLSGGGRYDLYYWPEGEDNDVFFIFKPIFAIAGSIFKLPIFRNIIGFIVGLPIAILLCVVLVALFIGVILFCEMLECWDKIFTTYLRDVRDFFKWIYWKATGKDKILSVDPTV